MKRYEVIQIADKFGICMNDMVIENLIFNSKINAELVRDALQCDEEFKTVFTQQKLKGELDYGKDKIPVEVSIGEDPFLQLNSILVSVPKGTHIINPNRLLYIDDDLDIQN